MGLSQKPARAGLDCKRPTTLRIPRRSQSCLTSVIKRERVLRLGRAVEIRTIYVIADILYIQSCLESEYKL